MLCFAYCTAMAEIVAQHMTLEQFFQAVHRGDGELQAIQQALDEAKLYVGLMSVSVSGLGNY